MERSIPRLPPGERLVGALLVLVVGITSTRGAMAGPATAAPVRSGARVVTPADRARLSPLLVRALNLIDPLALADTTLPRLADLDGDQRAQLAERLAPWDVGRRVAAWAFLQVGTPYKLGPLGEEVPPDTDPVIEFRTTDCAVLNLVSAALAHVRDAGGEREAMAIANYRGGRISYATRFHFTTDRLDSSPYYRDITEQVGGDGCRSRRVVLNRRADGSRWIPIDWSRTRRVRYVPRALGSSFLRWHDQGRLPAATGVAFVQVSRMSDGLDVVHESMLWKGRTFLHASSRTGRVVMMPWTEFLAGPGRRYDGFVLFEYR
jgi:N-acetylmuramoyl-L-alanine amidase-like protein